MPSVARAPQGSHLHFMLYTSEFHCEQFGEGVSSDAITQSAKQRPVLKAYQILQQARFWAAAWHAHCASRSQKAGCAHHFGAMRLFDSIFRAMQDDKTGSLVNTSGPAQSDRSAQLPEK